MPDPSDQRTQASSLEPMIVAHHLAGCVFFAASLLHVQGAAAVPEHRPESVPSTQLPSPPNWPPAVRYSGMINLTNAGTSNGKPIPVHVQAGPFFGWSVCDATSPHAQLQRLDSDYELPLPPPTPEMWFNGSSVTVCSVRTKFNDYMGSCTAEPLWGSLISGWWVPFLSPCVIPRGGQCKEPSLTTVRRTGHLRAQIATISSQPPRPCVQPGRKQPTLCAVLRPQSGRQPIANLPTLHIPTLSTSPHT